MSGTLELAAEWLDRGAYTPPDPTAARLRIAIDGLVATRAENRWSQTLVEAVPLSAGPLAAWLVGAWWRLRHEPEWPTAPAPVDWRMAHEIAAAGNGFLWPRLRLVCDGSSMEFDCIPSDPRSREMLSYVADFRTHLPVARFEQAVDDFVELVLERMASVGVRCDLAAAWEAVRADRRDPVRSARRRIEAMMGFDPDEAPRDVLAEVTELGQRAGDGGEVAAICAASTPAALRTAVASASLSARLALRGNVAPAGTDEPPHQRGYQLARWARAEANLRPGVPVRDADLADLLGMTCETLLSSRDGGLAPATVLVRGPDDARVLFRDRRARGRRFDAARLIGDALGAPELPWQLTADTKTARQKLQRAFAAEFLAPIATLHERLDAAPTEDEVTEVADWLGVGERLVRSQLVNHGAVAWDRWSLPA